MSRKYTDEELSVKAKLVIDRYEHEDYDAMILVDIIAQGLGVETKTVLDRIRSLIGGDVKNV